MSTPLQPSRHTMLRWGHAAVRSIVDRHTGGRTSATGTARPSSDQFAVLGHPPAEPGGFDAALALISASAAADGVDAVKPRDFAHVPSGGHYTGALGEFLARGLNAYTGLAEAPALVALEQGLIRWLCGRFGLPDTAGGINVTGASLAALTALVAARHDRLGENITAGTLYVTEYTHFTLTRAARVAGLPAAAIRIVPVTPDLTMDPHAANAMIQQDLAAGCRPFLLVATAGTTDTGAIDPLGELAAVAARYDMWLHVDAAYGGNFILTGRGKQRLTGIEHADSLAVDAHKGLSQPFGCGTLLVRDPHTLWAAFAAGADYLPDPVYDPAVPDYASLGLELSREYRGLRLWLPLYVHGHRAFGAMLDERLDLAAAAHADLAADPHLEAPWPPALSIVAFRPRHGGARRLLERIHATSDVRLSATVVAGRGLIRMCILSHHTNPAAVREALAVIHEAARHHEPTRPRRPVTAVG